MAEVWLDFEDMDAVWDNDGDLKLVTKEGDLIGFIYSAEVDTLLEERPSKTIPEEEESSWPDGM